MGRKKIPKTKLKTFKTWYGDNADELNQKRSDRYKNDPEYRERMVALSQEGYNRRNGILPNGERLLVSEGETFACWKLSEVSNMLGLPRQNILRYINSGFFPTMKFDGTKMQFITVDQVPLLKKFIKAVGKTGSHKWAVKEVADSMSDYFNDNWRNRDGSQKIIAGQK